MWNNIKTRKIALAGILLAISTICLYIAGVAPTSRLALISLASFVSGVAIIEIGIAFGIAYTFASIALGFLVMFAQPLYLVYAALFAPYALVKALIEKMKNKIVQYIIKLAYFNLVFFLFLQIFETLIFNFEGLKKLLGINDILVPVLLAGNAAFIIYDYAFTMAMRFYESRFAKKGRQYQGFRLDQEVEEDSNENTNKKH
ncbi:MAG: hypothetical protein WCQ41_07355 [Bacillota bacterium]